MGDLSVGNLKAAHRHLPLPLATNKKTTVRSATLQEPRQKRPFLSSCRTPRKNNPLAGTKTPAKTHGVLGGLWLSAMTNFVNTLDKFCHSRLSYMTCRRTNRWPQ